MDAIASGRLKKPLVAWCIGTCAEQLAKSTASTSKAGDGDSAAEAGQLDEVQFGHAGACANSEEETAVTKNARLRAAGAHVPDSFNDLGSLIR